MSSTYSQANAAENVYFNAILQGPPDVTGPNDGVLGIYDVTRTQPIIEKPSDYFASIVRMSIPLNSMPVFICPTEGPRDGVNLNTPWHVGISFNNAGVMFYFDQTVLWQPEFFAPPTSNPVDWFYFAFSYGTFVSMINVAISAAYAAFQATFPAAPQAVANQAPFIIYDSNTQLFSWVWHTSWATLPPATGALAAGQARVGLNFPLLAVFDGFRTLLVNNFATGGNHEADYVWENTGDNAYTLNGFANSFFTRQGFIAVSLLSNLRRLLVTTSSLPIVSEAAPSTPTTNSPNSNTSATLPILTDFVPFLESSADVRGVVFYQPEAQYRLTNMISDIPLYRVQLAFYWQTNDGTLYPLIISRNQQINVKLGFFKKSLYAKFSTPLVGGACPCVGRQ